MKYPILLFFALCGTLVTAQELPIDFESDVSTSDFVNFDGGTGSVEANPDINEENPSAQVGKIVRDGGLIWSGSKIILDAPVNWSTLGSVSMKVWTDAPVGTMVKFKLEGNGSTERDAFITASGEWHTLSWDFSGVPSNFNQLVFMFDFGNVGDGSANSTFYFDDIEQFYPGDQMDLPVTFDDPEINYVLQDFEGNLSSLANDPEEPGNTVVKVVKDNGASPSAGTTIGTPAGFATNIPLTLDDSKMTVRVWSAAAGVPVRLKVEASDNATHTCETQTYTTASGEWELIVFDFAVEAEGTAALQTGLDMGWTYNKASIFFNFGSPGTNNESVYFFDDVQFGEVIVGQEELEPVKLEVYPNPSSNEWFFTAESDLILSVVIYDLSGRKLKELSTPNQTIRVDASDLPTGQYSAVITTEKARVTRIVIRN